MTGYEEEIRHRAEYNIGSFGWLRTINYLLSVIDVLRAEAEARRVIKERKAKRKK